MGLSILMRSHHFTMIGDSIPNGGVQRHIEEVSRVLRARGHRVEWCYPAATPSIEPDLVVFHDYSSWDWGNIPLSHTLVVFHGWEGVCPPDPRVIAARQQISYAADHTIAVGEFIRKWYGGKIDHVIWGAVEPPTVEEQMLPGTRGRAVWVGRIAPDTEAVSLIESAAQAGWHVEVVGDGPLLPELQKRVPAESMTIRGFVDEGIVRKAIAGSEIVLASGYLSILTAYSFQRPVFTAIASGNAVKDDYIRLMERPPIIVDGEFPYSPETITEGDHLRLDVVENHKWSATQTWDKIADHYEAAAG